MTDQAVTAYTGVDNLEVMAEAVNYTAFLERLVAACLRPGDRILDFGAGAGSLALPLAAAGHRITCVEPDRQLRARLTAAGFIAFADLAAILPDSLDIVYSINVLEHIDDDHGAVARLRDRLRSGGRLLVYVPAFPCLFSSMDRKVGHIRRYRRKELAALLEGAGLQIERIAHQDCLGFFATWIFKLAANGDGTINRRALIIYDRCIFPLSRILDHAIGRWLGKNLLAVARRRD